MLSVTVPTNIISFPSFPTIHINMNFFSLFKVHTLKTTEKIMQNKYISAFTIVLSAPVE